MKKKILVILGNYFPAPSSVANCMEPLIKKLSETYSIDIVTDRKRLNVPSMEKKDEVTIYRMDDYRTINTILVNELKKVESSPLLRLTAKFFSNVLKTLYLIRYDLFAKERGTGGWEEKRVLDQIVQLDAVNHYEAVISASQPFQSHYIAERFKALKGNNLKWILFEFDPFAYNKDIKAGKTRRKNMFLDEKRILESADVVCLTPELYDYYQGKSKFQLKSKVTAIPFANLEKISMDPSKVDKLFLKENKINCLFAGQFYHDIRTPRKLLETFSNLGEDIHLTVMTNFSERDIKNYAPPNYLPSVVPFQSRDTALYNMLHADILVNVGNTVEHQVPGKIFEYMSTGKPILHFSKIENDPALKYLKRYPKVLIVKEWKMDGGIDPAEIEEFCKANRSTQIAFEEVVKSLGEYSGDVVQKKFLTMVQVLLGDKKENE